MIQLRQRGLLRECRLQKKSWIDIKKRQASLVRRRRMNAQILLFRVSRSRGRNKNLFEPGQHRRYVVYRIA